MAKDTLEKRTAMKISPIRQLEIHSTWHITCTSMVSSILSYYIQYKVLRHNRHSHWTSFTQTQKTSCFNSGSGTIKF